MKRFALGMLVASLLLLSGCRLRTTAVMPVASMNAGEQAFPGVADISDTPQQADANAQERINAQDDEPQPNALTRENPDAARREYDENANAEVFHGAEQWVHTEGEEAGVGVEARDAEEDASLASETAEQTATQIVPAQEAEDTGVDEDAEQADSALYYYNVLLQDRLGSLFECQRLYIYWETAEDHVTVFKSSKEHELILTAGGYDISAKRMEDDLTIDDGWVLRKNPDAIVKVVPSSVLGSGVQSTAAAERIYNDLLAREGWDAINARKQGRVLLLSEELLEHQALRTAAAIFMVKAMYPTQFEDTDPEDALQQLADEAGYILSGIYFYAK